MPNLSKFRSATLTIDGEPVAVRVARLKLEASEAYRARLRELLADASGEKSLTPDEAEFVRTSIETNLSVAPGELTVDGEPVTTGAQIMDLIGDRPTLILRALFAINGTTGVSEAEGKPSASESVSVPSSDGHALAPDGLKQETTVASAEPEGSAPIVDATAVTDTPSSGPTATSS